MCGDKGAVFHIIGSECLSANRGFFIPNGNGTLLNSIFMAKNKKPRLFRLGEPGAFVCDHVLGVKVPTPIFWLRTSASMRRLRYSFRPPYGGLFLTFGMPQGPHTAGAYRHPFPALWRVHHHMVQVGLYLFRRAGIDIHAVMGHLFAEYRRLAADFTAQIRSPLSGPLLRL